MSLRWSITVAMMTLGCGCAGAPQSPPTPAAPAIPLVDARAIDAHIKYLADDLLEGRAPATRGGRLASRYIAAQFEALGLEPRDPRDRTSSRSRWWA